MKISALTRTISLIFCFIYIFIDIIIFAINFNHILLPPYFHGNLFVILQVVFFAPLFYLASLLKLGNEKQWIQSSYYIFICFYFINLIINFISFDFDTMLLINMGVSIMTGLVSIFIAISMFRIRNPILRPLFKVYALTLLFALIYIFGVTLIVPFFDPSATITKFTSLVDIVPVFGEVYVIYHSRELYKMQAVLSSPIDVS